MRWRGSWLVVLALVLASAPLLPGAAARAEPGQYPVGPYSLLPEERIAFTIGQSSYCVDDAARPMDAAPFVEGGRTYVPLRYLGEALGATVKWYGQVQKVVLTRGPTTAELFVGRQAMAVNGVERGIDVAPLLRGGRTYLPARFVADAFGYTTGWDAATQTVVLKRSYTFSRDWLDPRNVYVYGRPPLEYLREVGATGTMWSVYYAGLTPWDLEYLRSLHQQGFTVSSNLPMVQGPADVIGRELQERACCRDIKGNPSFFDFGTPELRVACMCNNNPEWREFLKGRIREQVDGQADVVQLDEVMATAGAPDLTGFCDSCMAGFRSYLGGRYSSAGLLQDFGIRDLASFHYGGYLAACKAESVWMDPNPELRDEYLAFLRSSQVGLVAELVQYAREYAGREVLFSANLYDLSPVHHLIFAHLDLAVFEMPMGKLPAGKHFTTYLLGQSLEASTPLVSFPDIWDLQALSPEDGWLWRHWLAEAWACGGSLLLPHQAFTAGAGAFTLPASSIAPYTDFLSAQADRLAGASRLAKTAVLFDLRSTLANWDAWQEFKRVGTALQEAHIPFEVAYVGDGRFVTKAPTVETLQAYSVLVVPAGYSLDAATAGVLQQYSRQGGRVVYNAAGQDPAARVRATGVYPGLETNASGDLGIVACRKGDALLVHLVNYAYDYNAHDFAPQSQVRVTLEAPEGLALGGKTLKLLSPDAAQAETLEFSVQGGRVTFTVPGVHAYALAVLE